MKKSIVLLILLIMLIYVSLGSTLTSSLYESRRIVYRAYLPLLAVKEDNTGTVINVTIEAYYPGRGSIDYVVEDGIIYKDTEYSVEYSLVLASIITGYDYRFLDYKVIFPKGTRIEGTSATLGFLLLFTYMLSGKNYDSMIGATGLVAPNLIVGNVSGLREKYEAAMSYGLGFVVGPVYPGGSDLEHYYEAVDVLHALKLIGYRDFAMYTSQIHIDQPRYMIETFKKSYNSFIDNITKILSHVPVDTGYLYFNDAMKTMNKSKAYAKLGRWYVAASFAFNAYIKTIYGYLKYENGNIVPLVIDWIRGNQSLFKGNLHGLINRIGSLKAFDVILNAYDRYRYSEILLDEALNTSDPDDQYMLLATSLARIHTARHWLYMVYERDLAESLNTSILLKSVFEEYMDTSFKYLASMNYIDKTLFNMYMNASSRDNTTRIFEYGFLMYLVNFYMMQLRPIIFPLSKNTTIIREFNDTLKTLFLLLALRTGSISPSVLTSFSITSALLHENESLESIGFILSDALSKVVIELSLYSSLRAPPLVSGILNNKMVLHNIDVTVHLYVALLITGLGCFILGYGIGRIRY